jgi:hypothetical protein
VKAKVKDNMPYDRSSSLETWFQIFGGAGVFLWSASVINTILAEVYNTAPTTLVWFESASLAATTMSMIIWLVFKDYSSTRSIATLLILTAVAGLALAASEAGLLIRTVIDCPDSDLASTDICTTDGCSIRQLSCVDEGYAQLIAQIIIAILWGIADIALIAMGFSYRSHAERMVIDVKNNEATNGTGTPLNGENRMVTMTSRLDAIRANRSWTAVSKV